MNREEALQYIMDADDSKNKGKAFLYVKELCKQSPWNTITVQQEDLDEKMNA